MIDQTKSESASITKYDLLFESRITRVESAIISIDRNLAEIKADIKDIRNEAKSDFRWLLGFIIGGIAGLFGFMAHGFHWI